MIGPRIKSVTCPECTLRATVRERPSGAPLTSIDDITSKCRHHAQSVMAVLDCPSLKPMLLKADRAFREPP
jgi:hypothetical protein